MVTACARARWVVVTIPHDDPTHAQAPRHPWAAAWSAMSPQRRSALLSRVVDQEPIADLASRLGRSESDTEALIASSLLAFRREVVLGAGTGDDEECSSLVLSLVDSTDARLTRSERRALAAHADACPECVRGVGELLELDARLREGLLQLPGPSSASTPATADSWAPAFDRLSVERQTALVHGAAGAEAPAELAERLGTTETAARQLAASSVLAFRQTVLRGLPVGSAPGCALVAAHRTEDITVDAGRSRALRAHAAGCAECRGTVDEILALHTATALRPRVAALALGGQAAAWQRARPRRSWVPGVEAVDRPGRHRRVLVGAGLAVAAVTAFGLLGALRSDEAPIDVVLAGPSSPAPEESGTAVEQDETRGPKGSAGNGALTTTPVAAEAAAVDVAPTAAPTQPGSGTAPGGDGPPASPPTNDPDPDPDPGPGPAPDPGTPPLDVAVDTETGSVTVTITLLGDPIVISTPPIPRVTADHAHG